MFCVAEALLFPFGQFVITYVSKIMSVLILSYDFLKCLNRFVSWTCLYQFSVNDQIKTIFNYATTRINPLFFTSSVQKVFRF